MGLRTRFLSWREKADAIDAVEDMRRRIADLFDQTMIPPFDYFVDVAPGDVMDPFNRIFAAMEDFDNAAEKCLTRLRDGKR
jgi:hypothetical protein